jgi:ferredoxin-NADP reductase
MVERQKIRAFEVTVEEVVVEAPETVTLVLAQADATIPEYKAGQFLTVDPHQFKVIETQVAHLEHLKGKKELTRAYSMSSSPLEPKLAITIKVEPYRPGEDLHPPLLSPLLVYGMYPGARMHVHGFTGPYILPPDVEERTDHVLHLVAGSGAVPNFSLLKFSLTAHPRLRHTLICSNKTWADVIFREQLDALAKANPERLKVVHTITREPDVSGYAGACKGRICRELLEDHVKDPQTCFAYVCGPAITSWERRKALETKTNATPRFLESALGLLHEIGITNDRIKREAYG